MKKLIAVILTIAMIATLSACGAPAPAASSPAAPSQSAAAPSSAAPAESPSASAAAPTGTKLVSWIATEPESLDPEFIAWVHEFTWVYHMYEGLMRWDADQPGGVPVLGQAKEIKWDDTKTKATVTLRDDIVWSDGQPVKAQDFEYAWKRHIDARNASSYGSTMADFFKGGTDAWNEIAKALEEKKTLTDDQVKAIVDKVPIKAVDDKTLTFELSNPCPFFDYILAFGTMVPVREDIIKANGDKWTQTPATYITNGRYVLADRKPNETINLKKNDKYWDKDTTLVDEIDFPLLKDENAAYQAYQTDQVQFIQAIPLGELETAQKTPDYIQVPNLALYYYSFNVTKKPLDNPKVRQALALAIDKDYIVKSVTKAGQIPAYSIVPEGIVDTGDKTFRENGGNLMEPDYAKAVEQAKALLKEAGYPDGKGMPKIEVSFNSGNVGHKTIAEAVANMWKEKLGVTVELVGVEDNVFNSYRKELKHMIARDGWSCDWNDATSMLNLFRSNDGNNHTGWKNKDYDKLLQDAAAATDPAQRSKLLHDAEKLALTDMAIAPVYSYTLNYMLKPNIEGGCFSALGNMFFWNMKINAK
jgi:oligopeptide transport system substrate-binding protein